jgi:hypothetical protein
MLKHFIYFLSLLLLLNSTLFAFDTRTHVWIAQEIINDSEDGKVTIPPFGDFDIPVSTRDALLNNRAVFRMGTIGPDGFPDLTAGQATTHPGIKDGWQSDDWLKWVFSHAKTPKEFAFAYGYLTHASSDVFAHTYVNMYTGDIFDLVDGEEDIELRHIYLESFISNHLPRIKNVDGTLLGQPKDLVAVSEELPLDFITNTLLLNDEVMEQYKQALNTTHLYALYKIRQQVIKLDEALGSTDFTTAWVENLNKATRQYIKAASYVNQNYLKENEEKEDQSSEPLDIWLSCYTPIFTDILSAIRKDNRCDELDETNQKSLFSKQTQGLLDLDLNLDKLSKGYTEIVELIESIQNGLGKVVTTLDSTRYGAYIAARDLVVERDKLNDQFSSNHSDKELLIIEDMSERVALEMHLKDDVLDPEQYAVLYNAVIFSKLILLDKSGIKALLTKAGISRDLYENSEDDGFNILFNAIKTLDGNHQWLETAPPYPRANNQSDEAWPQDRHYAYSNSESHGLKLFTDEESRDKVFNVIFKGVLAPGLEQPQSIRKTKLLGEDYPYVTCNTIPFPNGVEDKRCLDIIGDVIVIEEENATTIETDDSTITATWDFSIEGIITTALDFLYSEGQSLLTNLIATIFGTETDIEEDGTIVSTTPTLKSLQSVSSQAVIKITPSGEIQAQIFTNDSTNIENIISLPSIINPESVTTQEASDGSIDVIITTKIPTNGIVF